MSTPESRAKLNAAMWEHRARTKRMERSNDFHVSDMEAYEERLREIQQLIYLELESLRGY